MVSRSAWSDQHHAVETQCRARSSSPRCRRADVRSLSPAINNGDNSRLLWSMYILMNSPTGLNIACTPFHAGGDLHGLGALDPYHRNDEHQSVWSSQCPGCRSSYKRRRLPAIRHQLRAAWTHAAHVHPHRCRSRPAIEAERQRTFRMSLCSRPGIRHVRKCGLGFAV